MSYKARVKRLEGIALRKIRGTIILPFNGPASEFDVEQAARVAQQTGIQIVCQSDEVEYDPAALLASLFEREGYN